MQKKQIKLSLKSIMTMIMVFAMVLGTVPVPGNVMTVWAEEKESIENGTKEHPYLIKTEEDWEKYAEQINNVSEVSSSYKSKYYKMVNDITVTLDPYDTSLDVTQVLHKGVFGIEYESRPFCGTFDGDGHTLTFKNYYSLDYIAPFYYVDGATICNLKVEGEIMPKSRSEYIGGIVGASTGSVTIQNCTSSISIIGAENSNSSCLHIGGIVGSAVSGSVDIENSIFDGTIKTKTGEYYGGAGFVGNIGTGQTSAKVNITDCLFAPKEIIHPNCDVFSFGLGATLTRAYRYWDDNKAGNNQGTRVYKESDNKPSDKILKKTQRTYEQGHYYWAEGEISAEHVYELKGSTMDLTDLDVKFDGELLVKDRDFTATVTDAVGQPVSSITSTGIYTMTITGVGDYSGSTKRKFEVLGELKGKGTSSEPFIISSEAEWDIFASHVNTGTDYKEKYIKLTSEITVSRSVGDSNHKFSGTFFGDDNSILNLDLTGDSDDCAPFLYLDGATIIGITVSGEIETSAKYGASIAAHTYGDTTIKDCHSTVSINGNINGEDKDGTHGGFVAVNRSGELTFENCDFKGKLSGSANSCGGFVGWNSGKISYTNCLFAPSELSIGEEGSATFNRNGNNELNAAYYVTALGAEQGIRVFETAPVDGEGVYAIIHACDGETYYSPCTVGEVKDQYQLGENPVRPNPAVTYHNATLNQDTEYTITWTEPENEAKEGEYSLTVTGKGKNYGGSISFSYKVTANDANGEWLGQYYFKKNKNGEYLIEDEEDLRALSAYVNTARDWNDPQTCKGKTFIQTADIDLRNETFIPIGRNQNFRGCYDGGNHTISGLVIDKSEKDESLFGYLYGKSTIKNVRILSPIVTASKKIDQTTASGLVGRFSDSKVENCVVINAEISSTNWYKGALIGWVEADGWPSTINDCFFYTKSGSALSGIGNVTGDKASVSNTSQIHRVELMDGLVVANSLGGADSSDFLIKGQNGSYYIDSGDDAGYYCKNGTEVIVTAAESCGRKLIGVKYSYIDGDNTVEKELTESDGKFSFTMPEADVTVTGTFENMQDAGVSIRYGEESAEQLEKTYGDDYFTLTGQVTTSGTNEKWTWESNDENVARVTSDGETATVTILKASDTPVTITAGYVSGTTAGKAKLALTVKRKPVAVSGLAVSDKEYDGNISAKVIGTAVLEGKLEKDDLTLLDSEGKAEFEDRKAGSDKTVTFSGYALSGKDKDNYVLSQPESVKADITKKEVTVSGIEAQDKDYDGNTKADLSYNKVFIDGICSGDDLGVEANGKFEDEEVGENKNVIIYGLELSGEDKGNYVLAESGQQTSAFANIMRQSKIPEKFLNANVSIRSKKNKTAEVSYTHPDGAKFGDISNENQEFFTVSVTDGDLTLTAQKDWTVNDWPSDETKTFAVSIEDAKSYMNYTLTVTVKPLYKAEADFSFSEETLTKTYGDGDFTFAVNHSDGIGEVTYKSSDEDVALVDNSGKVHILKASDDPVTITATAEETADFDEANASYELTVNRKTVTVKANDTARSVNETDPTFTVTVKGLVGSDTIDTSEIEYSREEGEAAGEYTITPKGPETQGNYILKYDTGVLRITEKKAETWTISFDSNGGKGSMTEQKVSAGSSAKLNANTFKKENYSFDGWNTKANGKGDAYNDGQEVTLTGDLKLYAQWTKAEKHSHHLELVERTEPGCETEGNKAYYRCTEDGCDKWFEDASGLVEITDKKSVILSPLGHKWDKGVVTKEATTTSTGIRTYTCLRDSSHTKTEIIPKKQVNDNDDNSFNNSDDTDNNNSSNISSNNSNNNRKNTNTGNDDDDDYYYDSDDDSGNSSGSNNAVNGRSGSSGSGANNSSGAMVLGASRLTVEKPESNTSELSDVGGKWIFVNGVWMYKKSDGSPSKNEWLNLEYDGVRSWYFFGNEGGMATGWIIWNGQTYYLVADSDGWMGRMATGWKQIDGKWYFFDKEKGSMLKGGKTPDGYTVGEDGVWDGKKKR